MGLLAYVQPVSEQEEETIVSIKQMELEGNGFSDYC